MMRGGIRVRKYPDNLYCGSNAEVGNGVRVAIFVLVPRGGIELTCPLPTTFWA